MAFRYTQFASVDLPDCDWEQDHSTPKITQVLQQSLNGPVDLWPITRQLGYGQQFSLRGILNKGSAANNVSAVKSLKALVGEYDLLTRVDYDGANSRFRDCRLLKVGFVPKSGQRGVVNEISMDFWALDPFWRGASAVSVVSNLTTGSSYGSLGVGGSEWCTDPIFTFSITSGTVTSIRYQDDAGADWTYSRSLSGAHYVVIDCGRYTVKYDGTTNDYANFALNSGHYGPYWTRLYPAASNATITVAGGGVASLSISYYPKYS